MMAVGSRGAMARRLAHLACGLILLACWLTLLAGGCGSPDVAAPRAGLSESPAGISPIERARARGVEFRASGNEPGWTLEMLRDRLVFVGDYGAERVITPRPAAQGQPGSGETVYAAITEAHRVTVRIRQTLCVNSMSGAPHDSAVEVELDGRRYHGCGEALAPP